jgi:hypothetical protein
MYDHIRDTHFPQITQTHKEFENKSNFDKLPHLLGEIPQCAVTAARCGTCCHKKRATKEEQTPLEIQPIFIFPFVLELFAHLYIDTVYRHTMTFEMSLFFWNICECNVYNLFHLLWQC